jgi:prepilin-type N-terminal cleavage/methylation domain-containing protein
VNAVPASRKSDLGHWRNRRRWPDLYRGFSLLEVILVVAIMAVFAAVAAPRYGRASGRYRADLAARRVVADLRLAQSCAKAASSSRTVSFSTGTNQYQLLNVPSPDGVAGDYTVVLSAEPYNADLTGANFNGSSQVLFNGWGLPNSGGTVVVSAGSEQRTIVVDGGTGRVSIQ